MWCFERIVVWWFAQVYLEDSLNPNSCTKQLPLQALWLLSKFFHVNTVQVFQAGMPVVMMRSLKKWLIHRKEIHYFQILILVRISEQSRSASSVNGIRTFKDLLKQFCWTQMHTTSYFFGIGFPLRPIMQVSVLESRWLLSDCFVSLQWN